MYLCIYILNTKRGPGTQQAFSEYLNELPQSTWPVEHEEGSEGGSPEVCC